MLDQRAGYEAPGTLLFRSPHIIDREAPLSDLRDMWDRIAKRAGWQAGEIRSRMFRVTYATTRLETLDHGRPVSPWRVQAELGHGSLDMLKEVYGRVMDAPHRSEVVEYRVEQHFDWDGRTWVPKKKKPTTGTVAA